MSLFTKDIRGQQSYRHAGFPLFFFLFAGFSLHTSSPNNTTFATCSSFRSHPRNLIHTCRVFKSSQLSMKVPKGIYFMNLSWLLCWATFWFFRQIWQNKKATFFEALWQCCQYLKHIYSALSEIEHTRQIGSVLSRVQWIYIWKKHTYTFILPFQTKFPQSRQTKDVTTTEFSWMSINNSAQCE